MEMERYEKALSIGFEQYGLNGFYEMHQDACKDPETHGLMT